MFENKHLLSEAAQASAIVVSSREYDLRGGGYSRVHLELDVPTIEAERAAKREAARTFSVTRTQSSLDPSHPARRASRKTTGPAGARQTGQP